jgi:hypothetical protein
MSLWDKIAAIEIPNSLSFAVTVISTLVAVVASVYAFVVKRPSIQVRCIEWRALRQTAFFLLCFENTSQLPTAITNVYLMIDGKPFQCEPTPTLVRSYTRRRGAEIVGYTEEFSAPLPIKVEPLSAQNALVLFQALPRIPSDDAKQVTFQVHAIGHRSKKFVVPLGRRCQL